MLKHIHLMAICFLTSTPATAATLNPADPGDAALIQSHRCNTRQNETNFSLASGEACGRTYAAMTEKLRINTALSAAQRNKIHTARAGLLTAVLASYAKNDGVVSQRICRRLPELQQILATYQSGTTPDWDKLHQRQNGMLRNMQGKCP